LHLERLLEWEDCTSTIIPNSQKDLLVLAGKGPKRTWKRTDVKEEKKIEIIDTSSVKEETVLKSYNIYANTNIKIDRKEIDVAESKEY